jgi:ethanolamine ammonia-lyase small subunit
MTKDVVENPWLQLKRFTNARIALGRAGDSLTTTALLDFGLAHAKARDAVHEEFDVTSICQQLDEIGFKSLLVNSAALNRAEYLRRPDLGRRLDTVSQQRLASMQIDGRFDVVFVVGDGLSARATRLHAIPLLAAARDQLPDWRIGPVVIAERARVAIGDEIGEALKADMVVVLIGERPGLSSPDSLGVYLTYKPQIGRTDAERNCISNIRPDGLAYGVAAHRLVSLLQSARRLGVSGVVLKDETILYDKQIDQ